MAGRSFSFVFICQQGELELQAMLLAASLKEQLRCAHELVAAVPGPAESWGQPAEATLGLLGRLGVRVVEVRNPVGRHYPIGNKLACLGIETGMSKRVFLDSDMVALRPLEDGAVFDAPFAARLAAELAFANGVEQLRLAFAAAGCRLPDERYETITGDRIPPYFNAGFIAVDSALGFGELWVECCRRIEADEQVTCQRPFLDQLGLAAAVCRAGLRYELLDQRYNWPRRLPVQRELPILLHYREPAMLSEDPRVREAVTRLAQEHPEIALVAKEHAGWELLAQSNGRRLMSWLGQ